MERESDVFRQLLGLELEPGPCRESLEDLGLQPSYENAIYLQILKKAAGGDFTAAKYVLENAGRAAPEEETPPVNLRELSTAALLRLAGALPEGQP